MSQVDSIVVIGAGTMGSGIAYAAAASGISATVVDVSEKALERARGYHGKTAGRSVEKGRLLEADATSLLGRIAYEGDLAKACTGRGFVIEAASERVDLKKSLFEATKPSNIVYDDTPIHVYMGRIHTELLEKGRLSFSDLFSPGMHKSTLVGIFLATLELVRHYSVRVEQNDLFREIWILPNLDGAEPVDFSNVDNYEHSSSGEPEQA